MSSVYKNVTILGTSHISKESILDIKKFFAEEKPEIIALELDAIRFNSLLKKKVKKIKFKDIKKIGITGFLFNIIGSWSSKKLGKITEVNPGSEMLTAIKLAKKEKIKIYLIDQDIRVTLKKLSNRITLKEKIRFLFEIFNFSKNRKKISNFDLSKVPNKKVIKKITKEFKKKYPSVYLTLITERNTLMAKNLNKIMNHTEDKILAIVGAGHEEEILRILKNEK